jgi:glycosyltransferase involved in cell wall biosynthesis
MDERELPPPPPGRRGWPWTRDDAPVPPRPEWPSLTLVIPSYAQGERIEAAIRSALLQGYPGLELMVFDAGSRDGTVAVLERYSPWISYWESRPDRGQSHAINKGWVRARGEVFNWLCCDDVLAPGALARVGQAFADDADLSVVAGTARVIAEFPGGKDMVMRPTPESLALMPEHDPVPQPSCFWRRRAVIRPLPVREDLRYAMDFDLWNHLMAHGARWRCLDEVLSVAHMSGDNKICRGGIAIIRDVVRVNLRYERSPIPLALLYSLLRLPLDALLIHAGDAAFARLLRPLQMLYTTLLAPFYEVRRIKALNAWSGLIALARATRAHRARYRRAPSRANSAR